MSDIDRTSDSELRDPARALLMESPSLFEATEALAHVGSWAMLLATGSVAWSHECYRIFGIPAGAPVTRELLYAHVHPDDRERVRTSAMAAFVSGRAFCEFDHRIVRADGTQRWLFTRGQLERDENGVPLRVVGVVQDITERKQALEQLRASEMRARRIAAIVEWSNDAIIGSDLDGTITSWNRSAARLFGYTEEEVLRKSLFVIVPDGLHDEAARLVERVHRGEAIEHHATVRRRKDGTNVEVSLTLSPIGDEVGNIIGVSKIVRDLSDQRRAETALRRAEQQLRVAQKMEAVGLLAGGVAHDFNNMLSVIVGYTELVLENLSAHDPLRSDIIEVRKAGASAVSLTRQLLAFSRRQMLQPRVIDLNHSVCTLERMVRRLLGPRMVLAFQLSSDLGRVSADPGQIEQVIVNLILNARDAMAGVGTLTIATANVMLDVHEAEEIGLPVGLYVTLAVSDTGTGIDNATRARIFEPFFTTKEKGKGTGLGLSTALGIVQQSNGAIKLDTELGAGTTFRIYLPRTERPLQLTPSAPPARVTQRCWETVLLVEDDDQVRALARTALRRHGYQVLEAEQGEQALDVCKQYVGPIHLLLTDVVMPRMGGRELAEHAAALRPDMKVLFMSGYANEAAACDDVFDESMGLLHKPITPSSLNRKVREILDSD